MDVERQKYLTLERTFIELNQKIKGTLGLVKADVDKCLELLQKYKGTNIIIVNRIAQLSLFKF